MATSQRPSAVVRQAEPAAQANLADRPELKALTTVNARAFLEPRLRGGVTFEQVLSEVLSVMIDNPQVKECTQPSLLNAVAKILNWGLTIGEKAYIVPFKVNAGTR